MANNFEYQKGYGFECKQFRLVKRRVGQSGKAVIKPAGFESFGTDANDYCDTQSQTHSWLIVGAIVKIARSESPAQPIPYISQTNQLGYFIRHYHRGNDIDICEVYQINNGVKKVYSTIHNIIPRAHHIDTEIITCMRIFQSSDTDRVQDKERSHWSRFPNSGFKILENESFGLAFHELNNKECEKTLREISDEIKDKNNTRSYVGIYVPKNTSLFMIDTFKDTKVDDKNHERTLFQEGSVIILDNTELRFNRFHYIKKDIIILNFDELGLNHKMRANPFFILRPVLEPVNQTTQPSLSSWGLRITHEIQKGKNIAILQIPENAEFEKVYKWEDGVTNVIKKMEKTPWNKYVCIEGVDNANFPIQAFNVPYPGYDANSIEDTVWAKESVSESESDHESHVSESRIVLTDEEKKYITRLNSYKESRTETNTSTTYQTFKDWTDEGSSQK